MIAKKILATALALAGTAAFSELHKPNRYFEIGVEAEAGASNNYFSAKEFMVKDLVIDLQKIADEMPKNGWSAEFFDKEKAFINFNFGESCRIGLFAGVEASGYLNLSKDLFDFLGSGIKLDEKLSVDLNGYFDVFLESGFSVRIKIREFGISLSPSYYVPLFYMPKNTATATWKSSANGKMVGEAKADLKVYSAIDTRKWLKKSEYDSESNSEISEDLVAATKNGGVDFTLGVEHPIFGQWLEVGGFARIPVVPGKLKYEATRTFSANIQTDGILKVLQDEDFEKNWDSGEWDCHLGGLHKVYRPMKFQLEAAFRPFGNWLSFRPMFALVIRDPYNSDRVIYPEYSLDATLSLANILSLSLGTAYLNKAFVQRALLAINARIIEIDAGIALRSPDFTKSFMGSGLSACVGVKIGF